MIAPSSYSILISYLCFKYQLQSSYVLSDVEICSSLNCLSQFKISFMHLIRDWCLQLLPNILNISFPKENLYLKALKYLSLEEYQMLMMSVLMAQIMLSKKLLKSAIRCQSIFTIFRYSGFLDSIFLMMEARESIHFKNLNIFLVFFIVPLILWATSAPVLVPPLNSKSTSCISEYLLQLQQKSAIYCMTEQILSLPLQVFMIMVKAETQVAICLPYWKDILEVSLMQLKASVENIRLKSFIGLFYEMYAVTRYSYKIKQRMTQPCPPAPSAHA